MSESKNFQIKKIFKGKIPRLPLEEIKNAILGADYSLSLVYTDKKLATELHKKWKKKDGPANILSFPLDKKSGEIFIYPKSGFPIDYLMIHGCVHLKGFTHGSKMEKEEKKWRKAFGVK